MEALTDLLSWRNVATTVTLYFGSLVFYRLFLHPLAKFPGPKLAAITRYYEAYFDVFQNGQYTLKIAEMHKKYGPIIRISPYELHIIDPAFYEKLYRQDGSWDKYAWAYNGFSSAASTICTVDHDVHKARRQPLGHFFSKARVAERQDLVRRNLEKLCDRLAQLSATKKGVDVGAVDVGAAISAFARDVSTEFTIGRNYNSLDAKDFNVGMTGVFQGSGQIWRTTKHLTWFGPTMKMIPIDWIAKMADEGTKAFFTFLKDTEVDTKNMMAMASSSKEHPTPTIVQEILDSNLPPAEKTFARVYDDVATVTGAGFETTAAVLRLIVYHVFSNAEILQRLRTELASVAAKEKVELRQLEQLPYLTSVLMEGLRLSPGLGTRMARIAPDRDLTYGEWRIPAGTPVGMTTLLMHTDEKLYPDPMRFDPERWMDLDFRKKAEKTFAPFSRGTRMCLGMHLAWCEMYFVVAAFAQRFNFHLENVSAEDFQLVSDEFTIGTRAKNVLNVSVCGRPE